MSKSSDVIKKRDLNQEDIKKLVDFFELLLKIDQRINPQDYGLDTMDKDGQGVYTKNIKLTIKNNG